MAHATLVATKLYAPPVADAAVPRPRLMARMHEGARGPLTLVSAPAGFGKTTLVSAWVHETELPIAWLSLDERDRDPHAVLAYVVAALQKVVEGAGHDVLAALQAPQPPPVETLAQQLVNDLAEVRHDVALVLDDYHAVEAREVDEALGFLLERLPPRVHLVVTTREDPDLPLARLRARGRLTELRAADLRFTPDEAAAFLNDRMGLDLTGGEVAVLEERTEGWIAGLQLAALSLRGRDDAAAFVHAFAGDHRFVVDYLVDEVLRRQPPEVRDFLLDTSPLDRLSAPLCEAVTGAERCDRVLQELERANLFLVPLDDRRRWFRYHHLFAEMLRTHLEAEHPDRMPVVLARASGWFEEQDDPDEAVRYALAAGDVERVARLIERFGRSVRSAYRSATLRTWLDALPDAVLRARPLASVEYARAANDLGDLDEAERRLRDAEAAAPSAPDDRATAVAAAIATARAYLAQSRADLDATVVYAGRALELLPEDDLFERGVGACVQGLAQWTRGDLEAGHDGFRDGLASMARAGAELGLAPVYVRADMRVAQGRLGEAERLYRDALEGIEEVDADLPMGAANLWLGLAELARERGETERADRLFARSETVAEAAAQTDGEYRWHLERARRAEDAGDVATALAELDRAEARWHPTPIPDVRPIAARRAGLQLRRGRLEEAEAWEGTRRPRAGDDESYLHEYERSVVARIHLARSRRDDDPSERGRTLAILARLRALAERQGRVASLTELLVVEALALAAGGELDAAAEALDRALRLAAPEHRVRPFTVEGAEMERLLKEAAARRSLPPFAGVVAAALRRSDAHRPDERSEPRERSGRDEADRDRGEQPLLEPLSERELEVLKLIADGLSNREIATRLYRALPTVKGYTREIYAKLQVQRRTEAVARARELGLI